ncbi:MAG: DUF1572 family protein, partial [Bacteroidota bacterium]
MSKGLVEEMQEIFMNNVRLQFQYYKVLGDRTFAQLEEEQLFWQFNPESNSIAVMVNHITGNMKSRWTDFLTSDGEKEWRNREKEFEDLIKSRVQLEERWEEGWHGLFHALNSITSENFNTKIYI